MTTLLNTPSKGPSHIMARRLHNAGFAVIPLNDPTPQKKGTGKDPRKRWKHFQESQSKAELDREFNRAPVNTNLGIIMPSGVMALDIDEKDSFQGMLDLIGGIGNLPDGPHQFSGGGGEHYLFRVPGPLKNAANVLGYIDLPGIDIRAAGQGYIAVEPSQHYTGNFYEWEGGFEPWSVDIPDMPTVWYEAILKGQGPSEYLEPLDVGEAVQRTSMGRVSDAEVILRFTTYYTKGERNDIIAKLTGHIKGRNICYHCTQEFLLEWQKEYFFEDLPPAEIRNEVFGLYKRDHKLNLPDCKHEDEYYIHFLRKNTDPAYVAELRRATEQQQKVQAATSILDQDQKPGISDELEAVHGQQRGTVRSQKMYRAVKDHSQDCQEDENGLGNGEFDSSTIWNEDKTLELSTYTAIGRQLGASGTKSTFLLQDPSLAPTKADLLEMQVTLQTMSEQENRRLEDCGNVVRMMCADHGERGNTHSSCKMTYHAVCPTHMTYKLRQLTLPKLEEGEYYREVWMNGRVDTDGADPLAIAASIETALKRFQKRVAETSSWVDTRKRIMARTTSINLARPYSRITYKVMIKEDFGGQSDKAIKAIARASNASVIAQRRFRSADNAVVQLMLDSMSTLAAMHDVRDAYLFEGFRLAMKGQKNFQTMGLLWGLMKNTKDREPPTCDVVDCDLPLDMVMVQPVDESGELLFPSRVPARAPPHY